MDLVTHANEVDILLSLVDLNLGIAYDDDGSISNKRWLVTVS